MADSTRDLFGKVKLPKWSATKEVARKLLEQRHDAAMADIPAALHELGLARDAAEPLAQAFRRTTNWNRPWQPRPNKRARNVRSQDRRSRRSRWHPADRRTERGATAGIVG